MNVIIDGPNNVGKSSLIKKMLNHRHFKDYKVMHMTQHTPSDYGYYLDLLNENSNLLLDRGPIGELVYSNIYNRKTRLLENELYDLIENTSHNTLYITLVTSLEELKRHYIFKGEKDSDECNDAFINKEIDLFVNYSKLNSKVFTVNYDFDYSYELVDNIIDLLNYKPTGDK